MKIMIVNVRQARLRIGWTQENLATAARIGRTTISDIERGRHTPTVEIALQLAHALNLTVEDLFQLEGHKK